MFDPTTLRPTIDVEPPAFHVLNPAGRSAVLLVCDHASNALPRAYGTLGIAPEKMFQHIAWDVGAAAVTRRLARRLDAAAVLGGTSRLFVDLNRYPDDETAIAAFSDGTVVHGNQALSEAERAHRLAWHRQYHNEVERWLAKLSDGARPVLLFIHSFTPIIRGEARPWHLGVLHDGRSEESRRLLAILGRDERIVVGDNKPYSIDQPRSFSIFTHAVDRGRPYVALEIRQDLIETEPGADQWAALIGDAFVELLGPLGVLADRVA